MAESGTAGPGRWPVPCGGSFTPSLPPPRTAREGGFSVMGQGGPVAGSGGGVERVYRRFADEEAEDLAEASRDRRNQSQLLPRCCSAAG